MVCFWQILHRSLIQLRRTTAVQICRVYRSTFFIFIFPCSYCVRSYDVITVDGIKFICILMCYFGQDWWYFSQICHYIYWLLDFIFPLIFKDWSTDYCVNTCQYLLYWKCSILYSRGHTPNTDFCYFVKICNHNCTYICFCEGIFFVIFLT